MSSPFSGINMMSYAMRNFQLALETSGHNVSNVNTPGYSRQRVGFATNEALPIYNNGWSRLGQGSHTSGIMRLRDAYLDRSANDSSSNMGKYGTAVAGLQAVENVYGEPSDTGIISALGKFFDSWSGLGSNPNDQGARFEVRNAGQVLTDRIRGAYQQVDQQKTNVDTQIQSAITQINNLATKIDSLNKSIRESTVSGNQPNDLLDQRDQAVGELSNLVNIHTETMQDGTIGVTAAGFTVVDNAGTMPFPTTYDPVAGTVTNGTITNPVRSGQMAGLFLHAAEVTNQKGRLDSLANTLRTQINTLHMAGTNTAGATNIKFFNDVNTPPQSGAIDFDLDPSIKADVNNIMTGVTTAAGDGGLALSLAGLRDTNNVALGSKTFNGYMQDTVANLASSVNYFKQAQTTEAAVSDQIKSQIDSVSGVSLDDEMADMVKYQRSYQAAAKTLSVFDQMSQDIISMLVR